MQTGISPANLATVQTTAQGNRSFLVLRFGIAAAGLCHAMFLIIFILFDITGMAIFNISSVLIYTFCYTSNKQGATNIAYTFSIFEFIAHAFLSTYYVGWEAGFSIYILCVVPFTFFSFVGSRQKKIAITLLLTATYIAIYIYSRTIAPLFVLPAPTITIVNCLNSLATFLCFMAISFYYYDVTCKAEENLIKVNKKLKLLAGTDPLTGLLNRRKILREVDLYAEHYQAQQESLAIILVDIDNFKQFNDLHGHDCGDYILVEISKVMKKQLGNKDRIARWGGEEFLIFLPAADETGLWQAAEKIRNAIYESIFVYKGLSLQATVTCGASLFSSAEEVDDAIKNADNGLYAGKQKGRNCVIVQATAFNLT